MPGIRALVRYSLLLLLIGGCSRPSADARSGTARHSPQTAFDACKSLSEGAACRVSSPGGTSSGSCRKQPSDRDSLACAPAAPPAAPPTGSNSTLTDSALEHKLDQLEREIRGS
jgi:hypothetical protein